MLINLEDAQKAMLEQQRKDLLDPDLIGISFDGDLAVEILSRLEPAEPDHETEDALRLLLEWAVECDFGYDNIPDLYEEYSEDIGYMDYIDGLIYIAKMEIEKANKNAGDV